MNTQRQQPSIKSLQFIFFLAPTSTATFFSLSWCTGKKRLNLSVWSQFQSPAVLCDRAHFGWSHGSGLSRDDPTIKGADPWLERKGQTTPGLPTSARTPAVTTNTTDKPRRTTDESWGECRENEQYGEHRHAHSSRPSGSQAIELGQRQARRTRKSQHSRSLAAT